MAITAIAGLATSVGGGAEGAFQAAETSGPPSEAAATPPAVPPASPSGSGPLMVAEGYSEIRLGSLLRLKVDGLDALMQSGVHCEDLILFLNGFALKGVPPVSCSRPQGEVSFLIQRTDENKTAWDVLLGKPTEFTKQVEVSLGADPEAPFDRELKMPLVVIPRFEFWVFVVLFALGLMLFYWRGSDLLRNSFSTPKGGGAKAYSLARFQMAVWFGLVIVSYALIWLITGELNSITESALVLVGLGSATGLGSAVVDSGRRESLKVLQSQKAAKEAKVQELNDRMASADAAAKSSLGLEKAAAELDLAKLSTQIESGAAELNAPSSGFLSDVLRSQGASQGVGLDRFQMLCWNVILGAIFVFSVFRDLSMPEFSPTLLALMGVSSGTFLGFKLRGGVAPSSDGNSKP